MNKQLITINNKDYTILDQASANIVDSFVTPSNKTGGGSGEARLYVAPQNSPTESFFIFSNNFMIQKGSREYIGCPNHCFLSKDNLLKYMEDSKLDYMFPKVSYRSNISFLYEERLEKIKTLSDFVEFRIYNQVGDEDTSRFYIGSASPEWDLIREICLPKITTLTILKLQSISEPNEVIYFFNLRLNSQVSSNVLVSSHSLTKKITNETKNDTSISTTERKAVITARNGQGKFRINVLSIMNTCPFTGISNPNLLRASHIIPWSECSDNHQRLDGYNGLALTPTYDTLFDLGLITFKNNGELIISDRLSSDEITKLNLEAGKVYNISNTDGKRDIYLRYHRNKYQYE